MVSLPSANPFEQTFKSFNTTNMFQNTQNKEVAFLTNSSFDKTITDESMSSFLTSTKISDEETTNKEPTIENTNKKLNYAEEIDLKKEEILKILNNRNIHEERKIFETTDNLKNRQIPHLLYEKLNGWKRLISPIEFKQILSLLARIFDINIKSITKQLGILAKKAKTGEDGRYEDESEKGKKKQGMAQKEKRSIWLVRHGECVDNVDKKWKEKNANKWDDPELTVCGKKQAFEVGRSFHNINIERIICSPFIRCVETAVEIVAMMENKPKICIEPGFMEPLNACMDPPSIPSMETIKSLSTRIDEEYKPVYDKILQEVGDLGCGERVVKTLKGVTEKFPEGHLLIISHGVPIANLHVYLKGPWKYVGQATLSKIDDNFGNFVLEYYNKNTHLSQPSDLHDDERMFPKA